MAKEKKKRHYHRHIPVLKQPTLHVHRYVVAVAKDNGLKGKRYRCDTKYHYALNIREVEAVRNNAPKGSRVLSFRATHDFVEAWQK